MSALRGVVAAAILLAATAVAAQEPEIIDTEPDASSWTADTGGRERPGSWLYLRQVVGVAGGPIGLLSDTQAEARLPLWRTDGVPFENTFAGLGGRLAVAPAFVDIGPRLTFAPIDVFDVAVQGSFVRYYAGYNSMSGYTEIGDTTSSFRQDAAEGSGAVNLLSLTVNPTLKLKVGPVIAVYSASVAWLDADQPDSVDTPLAYEVYRDLTVEWTDRVTEHTAAVIYEANDGDGSALLWFGANLRDTRAHGSGDRTLAVGPLCVYRPWSRALMPRFLLQGYWYLEDADYEGGPGGRVAVIWDGSRPF